jgi:hypothetical protein
MAHFAKLNSENIVIAVHSVVSEVLKDSNGIEQEAIGIEFLKNLHGWENWKKTSFNTHGNIHRLGGIPFRKNYAGIGFQYDEQRDAFIPPKPYNSWTLNENTGLWDAPVPKPQNNNVYDWNEDTQSWDLVRIIES